jgi:hypothetical protein
MEIELLLHDHCIETAAKRMYARLLAMCLKSRAASAMEDDPASQVEGLKYFLERVDFGYLRSRFPELNGSPSTRVVLKFSEMFNAPVIVCEGRDIIPKQKQQNGGPCISVQS